MTHRLLAFVLILIVGFNSLQAYDKKGTKTTQDISQNQALPEGVSIYQLDNGLEVLLIEKPSLPMIGANVVVKVGSAYETFATSGMSHMLEHLLFNGTTAMTQKELYDAVDRIGGYNNANTGEYYTNYMMVTPTENFKNGMQIQADMLFRSLLPGEKFEKEKGIVMEEIAKSLGKPTEQIERNIAGILYPGHALSLPTLGTYETIKNMNRDDVYRFYKNYYVPNNMRMSVVGNFNSAEMLGLINEIYGSAKPGEVQQSSTKDWSTGFNYYAGNDPKDGLFHRFYKGKNHQLQLFYDLPDEMSDELINLLDLQLKKLDDELQSELNTNTPETVESVKLSCRITPVSSYLQVTLNLLKTDNINEIMAHVSSWLSGKDLALEKRDVEVEVIKARTQFVKNTEKPHMFGIYNASTVAERGFQPIVDSFRGLGYYNAAEKLKVLKFPAKPVAILQYPERKAEKSATVSESVTELVESKDGSPTVITRQIKNNGILAIHYLIRHKAFLENKYGKNAAKIWHEAFGDRMKARLKEKEYFRFGLTFTVNDNPWIPMDNIYLHPDFGYIRAEGLADDIDGAIAFLNKEMLQFIPTHAEFQKAQGSLKRSAMMGGKNKAETVFTMTWKSAIYESIDNTPDMAALSYESLLEFGKSYFKPENMVISVVSPADKEKISNLFSDFTGRSLDDLNTLPDWRKPFKMNTEAVDIVKEENGEQTYLFYGFMKKIAKDETAAITALNLLLKDDIVFDIREKRGMAYRMSAGIDLNEDLALFYIRLGTRAENADKLVPDFPSFFSDDFSERITQEELTKAVNMYLGRMMFRRLSSINQGYYLGESYYFEGDYNADAERLEALKNVTLDQVKQVADKYLAVENPIQVIVK